jgi:uncharacterized phage protein gp47/JayE
VSYTPRTYDEIVRDTLTVLSRGTVRESLTAPPPDTLIVPAKLKDRPVRRVSFLEGFIGTIERPQRVRFTDADFELVSTSGNKEDKDAIRFREKGRRPLPGSALTVNYYPVQTEPVLLTDFSVGSVLRTLLETIANELALTYQHLDTIYNSAFVETAEGSSLDKVVALVGVRRLAGGHPVAKVRFSRREDAPGRVTIPAGTVITDADNNRYLTQEELILEPGESSRDVFAVGETAGTKPAAENALTRPEIVITGIDAVTNPRAAERLAQPESDEQLRRRARGAFHGAVRGTGDALEFHLRSLDEVRDVSIVEEPNGIPGEIRIDVAYAQGVDTTEAQKKVTERIRQVRPAGIRVVAGSAARRRVRATVHLVLAGTGVSGTDMASLQAAIEEKLAKAIGELPPGGAVRQSRISALLLQDARVIDGSVAFKFEDGATADPEFTLDAGTVVDLIRPVQFDKPEAEVAATGTVVVKVSALLPVHLTPGTTHAQVTTAIENAVAAHLATRAADAPLTFDSLAGAIRDDTRFALIRAEGHLTIEVGDRFMQLTDGAGEYRPGVGEALQRSELAVDVREGGV